MNKEIFKSDRYFTFFDITVSHGKLLLRSQKNVEYNRNIDIIFYDTNYIQMFANLEGVTIRKIEKVPSTINYSSVQKYLQYDNNYFFELKSDNENYYVAASFVRVFENQLEFYESSLHHEEGTIIEIANSL